MLRLPSVYQDEWLMSQWMTETQKKFFYTETLLANSPDKVNIFIQPLREQKSYVLKVGWGVHQYIEQ